MRRPSAATAIALLALFVALGGPAQAQRLISGSTIRPGTITSKQVKARSLSVSDLTLASSRVLQRTPPSSVAAAEVRDGSLGARDLATDSVFADELAPSAVGGDDVVTDGIGARALAEGAVRAEELADGEVASAEVRDGVLTGADVGRFSGRLTGLDFGVLDTGRCATRTTAPVFAIRAGEDLRDDAIVLTPASTFPRAGLAVSAQAAGVAQVSVTVCNVAGPAALALGVQAFAFVSFEAGS
jgi:hypothetical protein